MISWVEVLKQMIEEHPNANIVADVGQGMLSGYGSLCGVDWEPSIEAIVLRFL